MLAVGFSKSQIGKNIWKIIFLSGQRKVGNFVIRQRNLERTWQIWERSENLKISGFGSLQETYSGLILSLITSRVYSQHSNIRKYLL